MIDRLSANMTLSGSSFPVLDASGGVLGAVVRDFNGRFVAWTRKKRAGEFETMGEAERAVRLERAAETKKK